MKRLTKNSLLSFLVVALLAIVCAFGVMGYNNSNTAKADWQAPDYSAATVAESGFYFEEGAGVRTTTKGIKFQARVTEEFDATGDYTYFATAKVNGGAKEVALQFSADPVFNETGVAELNAYINFDNVSEAIWQTALAADWEVNAYAYDGANCIKAANGGEENLRSMRYVATAAVLDWTEDAAYDKEDLTSYFTEANIQEGINGYTEATNGDFFVSLPGAPVDATEIYVNAEKYDADNNGLYYDEEISRFWMTYEPAYDMELGTINKAMMFTEDGKVYATKIAQGTPIATEDDMITYLTSGSVATYDATNAVYNENAKDVEGYYFLTADIEMTQTWGYVSNLYGTLDGQGYTISNIKYAHIYRSEAAVANNKYFALFNPFGGTIKNIGLKIESVGTHGGLVFGQGGDAQDSTMENLFVDVRPGYHTSALIEKTQGGHHTIKNVILHKRPIPGNANAQSTANHFTNPAADKTAATWTIQNVYATANSEAKGPNGVTVYDGFAELALATKEVQSAEQARALKTFNTWVEFNQDTAAEVLSTYATGFQYIYQSGDVDISKVTYTSPNASAATGFKGIFDGQGYTISNSTNIIFGSYANSYTVGSATYETVFKNVVIKNAKTGTGVLVGQNDAGKVTYQNIVASFATNATRASLCGYGTGAQVTATNIVCSYTGTASTSTSPIFCYAVGGKLILTNVHGINFPALYPTANATDAYGAANPLKADGTTTAEADVDYFIHTDVDAFLSALNAAEPTFTLTEDLENAVYKAVAIKITQENAATTFAAGLGAGYYLLAEDIDLAGATVNAASGTIFSGTFNGDGHTIANVSTKGLLASNMSGKAIVKNVGFYGITCNGTGGVLANQSNNTSVKPSDILIENVVVNYHAVSGSHGLLGQSVGMNVKFSNVVVNFEETNTTTTGYIGNTSMSGTKVYDKFIGIGSKATITTPTGTYASTTNSHIAGFYGGASTNWGVGYEYGADGTSAPVANKDYYNFASYADFEAQLETNAFGLSDMALALIAKTGLIHKITAENVGILRNVTNGDYYLAEDIDMSQVDLNGDAIVDENDVWTATQARNMPFVGTLDGNGYSITNLKLGGKNYNGFFACVGGGALIKDIKIDVVSQAHLNATLIGMINTGLASGYTLTDGRVLGEINVVNSVISSKDLTGNKALITVFYNSTPSIVLTDVVLVADGTYDAGYAVTDGGGNTANLTANNVLVVVAETETSWLADGSNTAETVLTGELVFAADTTSVGTMYAENATILGFFGLDPK